MNTRKKYFQEWYIKNKEKLLKQHKDWKESHKKEIQRWTKKYIDKNRKKISEYQKKWRKKNKKRINLLRRNRKLIDIGYKIECNLRRRLHHALKGNNKSKKTLELLGCSIDFLKKHIENQFTEGMNWDNYGKWEIDHIIPCAKFDLSIFEEQKKCFHYTNLQPLWELDNLKKAAK